MKLEKIVNAFFKQDPLQKELRKSGFFNDSLSEEFIFKGIVMFQQKCKQEQQESFLKNLIKQLEEKCSISKKLKIMSLLLEISKVSKYDVCDIILNKKIKVFTKPSKFKGTESQIKKQNLDAVLCEELLIPMYNYLMKLSTNEQLYNTCKEGEIPNDDIFRRGTKIRFIWIFKLYNLINILVPIISTMLRVLHHYPDYGFILENACYLLNDLTIMNNFIIKALEEATFDNYMLMPYFDMLQFHESLKQQEKVGKSVQEIYKEIKKLNPLVITAQTLNIPAEEIEQIDLQALRVKLISNSLKNPKKDHSRLETEYQDKVVAKSKLVVTEQAQRYDSVNEAKLLKEKFKNLS